MIAGVVAGVLLILISFGINEPFMTNGYADPMWSLAAPEVVIVPELSMPPPLPAVELRGPVRARVGGDPGDSRRDDQV
jgi:hypothetical protein